MDNGLPFSILVVDDDEDDRMMIDEAFLEIKFAQEVKKFVDAKSLFHYLENVDCSLLPSLIILDNSLPEDDAFKILSQLRENEHYKQIPVVIYTTSLSPSKEKQLLAKGAYACFEKGNTMKEIVQIAKRLRSIAQGNSIEP
jgi:CheY-like chemotaxis protein